MRRLPRCPDSGRKRSHYCESETVVKTLLAFEDAGGFWPRSAADAVREGALRGGATAWAAEASLKSNCVKYLGNTLCFERSVQEFRYHQDAIRAPAQPPTPSNSMQGNPTGQPGNKRRKRTKLWVAHPPISVRVRECCVLMNEGCGKCHAECTEKWPDATGMVRPPTNTFVTLSSRKDARR